MRLLHVSAVKLGFKVYDLGFDKRSRAYDVALPPSSHFDDFQEGVCLGGSVLELDGNHTKQPDGHRPCSGPVPCNGMVLRVSLGWVVGG